MPYSESLAERIRHVLKQRSDIQEKKMFGSVCFLMNGNLLVGVWQHSLIARLGAEQAAASLTPPFVKEFDVTGKQMKGWVIVEPEGIDYDWDLQNWIVMAETFVATLPKK